MEQRLANTWRMTVNEKKFIESALESELRIDGRRPFDYRRLTIKFGREDGSSEVQLGQTHVMGFVTSQLVQPYRDRPNEGTLSVFTEFSPMADPSFEAGRPSEYAVELGRIIDRGLRESRAVDTESLCVVAGKWVWSIRIDLHILDNGGNLVDASNVAALAALLTFRRPECTLGGDDRQEVILHPPEVREPLPLIIHHLPIAVTFAFIGDENLVIDPTHHEEAVMGGRMSITLNTNGEVCAFQKPGGQGTMQSVVMQCLRIASVKAGDITSKIKTAVESYNTERALKMVKRHANINAVDVNEPGQKAKQILEGKKIKSEECSVSQSDAMDVEQGRIKKRSDKNQSFTGGPSSWDPYSEGVNTDELKANLASRGSAAVPMKLDNLGDDITDERKSDEPLSDVSPVSSLTESAGKEMATSREKTLQDAVKPKNRRRKKKSSNSAV
ncbi:PREDICTED: exosome complex component RRP45A-like isoform X1 [Nicotiana attenuata]|uniref:exosome complex component RRP45A-like isoform X1 n=1 Tax=Nicotiana attenuata TaxID=49451 RepID=UPI000905682A|nr:PREDICTED: exosome complex component RRP45A-like isoform X1 [Nicotiana attenuata]